ncbi:MAG: hypothetical protein B7Z62_08870 [Deltaproteobacteria bacterium 37-65-8]|nr:MAG: hypothetical protein B7Z62_08870 [Deltaproteobacteria bacterium 37-65-8]
MPEETTTQTTTTQPHPQNETFSKEYVAELNKENGKWRIKSTEQETRAQEAENAAKKAAEEADAKVAAASKAADARVILAEMKAVAIKAGMVDVDGLKLADLSNLKLSESGEVEGAEAPRRASRTCSVR